MIVRAGQPQSVPVMFPEGPPSGNFAWNVADESGAILHTATVAMQGDEVSYSIVVDSEFNELAVGEFASSRDVAWTYTQEDGQVITGHFRYMIEALAPYGASENGVRLKLGLDKSDLRDDDISLIRAFLTLRGSTGADNWDNFVPTALQKMQIRDAIEAQAALALLPSLQVRVANKESSGTNQYQRQKIDWLALAASLQDYVITATVFINPTFDATLALAPALILVTPGTDLFTGEASA